MSAPPEPDRGLWLDDAAHREDLVTFVDRALRLDDSGVIRLRERAGGAVVAWVATGFDVLASRVVGGRVKPADLSVGADALAAALPAMTPPPGSKSRTACTRPSTWSSIRSPKRPSSDTARKLSLGLSITALTRRSTCHS